MHISHRLFSKVSIIPSRLLLVSSVSIWPCWILSIILVLLIICLISRIIWIILIILGRLLWTFPGIIIIFFVYFRR